MVYQSLVSSIIASGDVEEIFAALQISLEKQNFKEISSVPPKRIELQRGKGGLLTTKIQNCKTVLRVSLKGSNKSDSIDILFDYTFDIPGLFTNKDKQFILGELVKIHHDLFDISSPSSPGFLREYKHKRTE